MCFLLACGPSFIIHVNQKSYTIFINLLFPDPETGHHWVADKLIFSQ